MNALLRSEFRRGSNRGVRGEARGSLRILNRKAREEREGVGLWSSRWGRHLHGSITAKGAKSAKGLGRGVRGGADTSASDPL
jgi:hypothetical protein